ncbi:copper amine oxidase N-terminal domain-containing protein [Cohnella lupini]|uniref:Copper amine oxidase-like protein n=1 Tax=Cohnella lupini TaxID=1294267 RepID=A0A3D9I020_9BACL|nr:copper amine oxidase N-terminal domain-containing protein [Cohnella lupini]RED55118.1 copper amine oxidase-like protein [Cohnella lupini]
MRKEFIRMLFSLMVMVVSLAPMNVSFASSDPSTKPIFKINDFFVLYTSPKAPYVDPNNRLMIPVRFVSELLGANVNYNGRLQEATISKGRNSLKLKVDSTEADNNGTVISMDTAPEIVQNHLYIPIRVLIDSMNLPVKWDKETAVIQVVDESLNDMTIFSQITDINVTPKVADNNAILPLWSNIQMTGPTLGKLTTGTLSLRAQNVSGQDISAGKEDLHVIFSFEKGTMMEMDVPMPDQPVRERPFIDKGAIFERTLDFSSGMYNEQLNYIFALGRTFE